MIYYLIQKQIKPHIDKLNEDAEIYRRKWTADERCWRTKFQEQTNETINTLLAQVVRQLTTQMKENIREALTGRDPDADTADKALNRIADLLEKNLPHITTAKDCDIT